MNRRKLLINSASLTAFGVQFPLSTASAEVCGCSSGCQGPIASETTREVFRAFQQQSKTELEALFRSGTVVGGVPHGVYDGLPIFCPGLLLNRFARTVWRGKIFDRPQMTVVNRIVRGQLATARLSTQPSWLDCRQTIVLDYSCTEFRVLRGIRDEIRELPCFAGRRSGVYLGRAYNRGRFILNFALVGPQC